MISNENTKIIDCLVEAYNSSNARAFADLFASDVVVYEHPNKPTQQSREEIFERYTEVFKKFPLNETEVVHRIVIGDWVIRPLAKSREGRQGLALASIGEVTKSSNEIKSKPKPLAPIAVSLFEDTKDFEVTNNVLHCDSQASEFTICPFCLFAEGLFGWFTLRGLGV
jgi:hypothetical protein